MELTQTDRHGIETERNRDSQRHWHRNRNRNRHWTPNETGRKIERQEHTNTCKHRCMHGTQTETLFNTLYCLSEFKSITGFYL